MCVVHVHVYMCTCVHGCMCSYVWHKSDVDQWIGLIYEKPQLQCNDSNGVYIVVVA